MMGLFLTITILAHYSSPLHVTLSVSPAAGHTPRSSLGMPLLCGFPVQELLTTKGLLWLEKLKTGSGRNEDICSSNREAMWVVGSSSTFCRARAAGWERRGSY